MTCVSVCMATYNGSAFVYEQVASILVQLGPNDELIIVDDASVDNTTEIIEAFGDQRIRLFRNLSNLGINCTFEAALARARGMYIFLSDQDDVWLEGRLDLMTGILENSDLDLVISNFRWIDEAGNILHWKAVPRLRSADSKKHWQNVWRVMLGRASYFGCAMAFRASFRDFILPLSSLGVGHDEWISIAANVNGSVYHLEDDTLSHRLHSMNASVTKRPLYAKLVTRVRFAFLVMHALSLKRRKQRPMRQPGVSG